LAGIVGLMGLLMIFGYMPAILERGYLVRIDVPTAAGLHDGSRVRYAGIDVGSVEKVELVTTPHPGVQVTARNRPDVPLPQTVEATVSSPLFGGGASIDLTAPPVEPGHPMPPLATDGSARLTATIPSVTGSMARELRAALEAPAAQFEQLTEQFHSVSAQ